MKLSVVFTIAFTLCAAQLQMNFGSNSEGSSVSVHSVNPIKHIFNAEFEEKSIIPQLLYHGLIPYALYKNVGGHVKLDLDPENEIYGEHHSMKNPGKVQAQAPKDIQYRRLLDCFTRKKGDGNQKQQETKERLNKLTGDNSNNNRCFGQFRRPQKKLAGNRPDSAAIDNDINTPNANGNNGDNNEINCDTAGQNLPDRGPQLGGALRDVLDKHYKTKERNLGGELNP